MNIADLEKSLDEATKSFVGNLQEEFVQGDCTPATKQDLRLLAQTTHAALDDFKKSIVDYLKSNQ